MTANEDKRLVRIPNIRVLQPKGYRFKDSCTAFLELSERSGKYVGSYSLKLVLRTADGAHEFKERFMGGCDFRPTSTDPSPEEKREYLIDLIERRKVKIDVHTLEEKKLNTCVSIMYAGHYCSHYHALKGDPRGMDNTKNPGIDALMPFFEKIVTD
jgi:hypothetical protein